MNKDLKRLAAGRGVKQWQIAERLGLREETFCRLLRKPLKPDMREKVIKIIDTLSKESARDD